MASSPFIKTEGIEVTTSALKALPITLNRNYLAIFNPAAGDLQVALGNDDAPAATDYFVIPADSWFQFFLPPSSAVWLIGAATQNAVIAHS